MPTRPHVVALARHWIGTPYHHQSSTPGAGCDCIGLIRGVWRTLYATDIEPHAAYTRDWAEASSTETLLLAARRHLTELAPTHAQPGDILIFRFRPGAIAKHAAIFATPTTIIHAVEGRTVAEVPLANWWQRRIAGAFAFPGIID